MCVHACVAEDGESGMDQLILGTGGTEDQRVPQKELMGSAVPKHHRELEHSKGGTAKCRP